MKTKIYLLEPTESGYNSKKFGYDCNHGFVIRAESEIDARTIASENASDEGPEVWLNPKLTKCIEVKNKGETGILLTDFKAG